MFFIIKRKLLILICALIVISIGFYYTYATYSYLAEPALSANVIIIDPGHGGIDSGAVGKCGALEKDLNLQISLKLKDKLLENGFNIIMTRDTDISLHSNNETKNRKRSDLNNRLKITKEYENALLISIHMNAFEASDQKGAQVFYSPNHPKSKVLAEILEKSLKEFVDSENKRVCKVAGNDIFLIKNAKMPSCLIECGFISNREEEKKLSDEVYQDKIVLSIVESFKKYMAFN